MMARPLSGCSSVITGGIGVRITVLKLLRERTMEKPGATLQSQLFERIRVLPASFERSCWVNRDVNVGAMDQGEVSAPLP